MADLTLPKNPPPLVVPFQLYALAAAAALLSHFPVSANPSFFCRALIVLGPIIES